MPPSSNGDLSAVAVAIRSESDGDGARTAKDEVAEIRAVLSVPAFDWGASESAWRKIVWDGSWSSAPHLAATPRPLRQHGITHPALAEQLPQDGAQLGLGGRALPGHPGQQELDAV